MQLLSVELRDFRNYEHLALELHPCVNLFVGENGMGKTNFLEAVFLLATASPLRGHKGSILIREGSEQARVSGRVALEAGGEVDLAVKLAREGRELYLRGKQAANAVDYFGNLEVVAFTPEDVQLFTAAPSERRRYLDRVIFNHDPSYLEVARRYRRALSQRNRLLADISAGKFRESELDAWDEGYAALAAEITCQRGSMVATLQKRLGEVYSSVFQGREAEDVELHYRSEIMLLEAHPTTENLLPWIREKRKGDIRRGTSQLGPHRDDLLFHISGQPMRSHGSQGQRRTLVLALKLAEVLSLSEQRQEHPLVLLDDLSSELDADRARRVLSYLCEQRCQLFITSTAEGSWGEVFGGNLKRFEVLAGRVQPLLA